MPRFVTGTIWTVMAVAITAPSIAFAELESELQAFVVTETSEGAEKFMPANVVKPGQTIEYRLVHTNTFDDAIGGVTVVGPVPEGGELIAGYTSSDVPGMFEVQGEFDPDRPGEEWAALPAMRVVIDEDGTRRVEEAKPEDFTAVRWRLDGPMQRNASVSHAYRVEVK